MITTSSSALLRDVREALSAAGVSQLGDRPGLPHQPEVETWTVGEEVILKVTVAPDERPDAGAIPERVRNALRSHGLAAATSGTAPGGPSPEAALGSGHAVRIVPAVRGH
ncbi:hypothetical protein [Streptomyces graminilatus]|uniref:hypothetical protein n=1 Tax=Streptomyces graminilatus TaxID=1464070 RepID=UPI0006E3BD65|nr:hypothetical protein [Streptomyces graminilatus]